jgi:hypothetical protein
MTPAAEEPSTNEKAQEDEAGVERYSENLDFLIVSHHSV